MREVSRYPMLRIHRLDDSRRLACAGTYTLLRDATPALPLMLSAEQRAARYQRLRDVWSIDAIPWVVESSTEPIPLDFGTRRNAP